MKNLLTIIFIGATLYCSALTSGNWRWRNDDGDQLNATWKADENKSLVTDDTSSIRLRIELYDNNGTEAGSAYVNTLQYATDTEGPWTVITDNTNNDFVMSDSPYITHGDLTTSLPGLSALNPNNTFSGGNIIDQIAPFPISIEQDQRKEYEFCFKPTSNIQFNTLYYLRKAGTLHNESGYSLITYTPPSITNLVTESGEKNTIKMFPNPSTENITLELGDMKNGYVTITDIKGQQVYFNDVITSANLEISLVDFEEGTYIVTINNSNSKQSLKLIKN